MKDTTNLEEILPLTPSQEFFLNEDSKSSISKIHVYGYRLKGVIDEQIAEQVWRKIILTYPSLRTSLHILDSEKAFQAVHNSAHLSFSYFDIRHLPPEKQEQNIKDYQEADSNEVFNWHVPPLIRIALHKLHEQESVLSVTIDHMIFDGWSLGLAMKNFLEGHDALSKKADWEPTIAPSMRDYIEWHRKQDLGEGMEWMQNALDNLHSQKLPFTECETWPETICATDLFFLPLTEDEFSYIKESANKLGVTLYVLFQAAWSLVLSECQKEKKAYFLSTSVSRPSDVPAIQSMFGLLLGVLPYFYSCDRVNTVGDWFDQIHAYQVEAMNYHYVPPNDIIALIDKLAPEAQASCLVFHNMDTGTEKNTDEKDAISVSYGGLVSRSNYPIVIGAQLKPSMQLSFMYDNRIFSEKGISKLALLLKKVMMILPEDRNMTLNEICECESIKASLREAADSIR